MAITLHLPISTSLSLFIFLLCNINLALCLPQSKLSDIHDLIPQYGLPRGLLPDGIQSYTLSPSDGSFTVLLKTTCYVHFGDHLVYYDKKIGGKLSYGSVNDVSGIQAKKGFLWLPVTSIEVTKNGDSTIQFFVGPFSEKLPLDLFQNVPQCKSKAALWRPLLESI
ncbi:hypothetical protein LINPERPRIM_LOCUS36918 [Linum perenne]